MGRGQVRMLPVPELADQTRQNEALRPTTIQPIDRRVSTFEPMDIRVQPGAIDRRVEPGVPVEGVAPAPSRPGELEAEGAPVSGAPDIYAAMVRERGGTLARPIGPTGVQEGDEPGPAMLKARSVMAQPAPHVEMQRQIEAEREGVEPLPVPPEEVPTQPLRSFVGSEQSQLNEYLAEAEALLHAGRYYQAAGRYELARTVAPNNPLPLLGRSMALLAAGEYLTSAGNLFHAIRLFDSLALYDLDMKAFVPDLAMLDRRRADLEQRLERHEVYKLRFLLGYAEYCSGLERLGLGNLDKAAGDAPEELSYLQKFVDTLRSRHPDLTRPIDIDPGR
jgi:hypothetical protein